MEVASMKKRGILFCMVLAILFASMFHTTTYALDLDQIENMTVTVDTCMTDASLNIQYEITWKVLDSTTEGPLTWVRIGTPNSSFENPTAITDNIKSIKKDNQNNESYVRIDLDRPYKAGESVTFRYSIHQPYMCEVSGNKCKFEFTPAWFTNSKVDNLTIRWNADRVKKSDSKFQEDNYLIWNRKDMQKGEKLTAKIEYKKSAFSGILSQSRRKTGGVIGAIGKFVFGILCVFTLGFSIFAMYYDGGGGYYGHRGFYRNGRWHDEPKFYGRRMCSK